MLASDHLLYHLCPPARHLLFLSFAKKFAKGTADVRFEVLFAHSLMRAHPKTAYVNSFVKKV
jgi:hypothetical protein